MEIFIEPLVQYLGNRISDDSKYAPTQREILSWGTNFIT